MKLIYRILRTILVTALILAAVIPAVLYVALSLTGVQRRVADRLETELSALLDARVTIGDLGVMPFNRVILRDVVLETAPGDTALTVSRLGAGVSLFDGLLSDTWRVDYVQLIGLDARLRRDSLSAPLNIQGVIDALGPKDKTKPPTSFDLKVSTVIIRSSSVSYDVADKPVKEGFDPNHLRVSKFRADLNLPRLTNDDFTVNLRRMAFEERSGFAVRQLSGAFHISASELEVKDLDLELPASRLRFADIRLPLEGIGCIPASLRSHPVTVALSEDSHIWPPDLQALWKPLDKVRVMTSFPRFSVAGTLSDASARLRVEMENLLTVDLSAGGTALESADRSFHLAALDVEISGPQAASVLSDMGVAPKGLPEILSGLGHVFLSADGDGSMGAFDGNLRLTAAPGKVSVAAGGSMSDERHYDLHAEVETDGYLDLGMVVPSLGPAGLDGKVEAFYAVSGKERHGNAEMALGRITLKGHELSALGAELTIDNDIAGGKIGVDDRDLSMLLDGSVSLDRGLPAITLTADVARLCPDRLGLWGKYPGAVISGNIDIDIEGPDLRSMDGHATVSDLSLKPADGEALTMSRLCLTARRLDDETSRLDLESDWLDGSMLGEFDFPFLGEAVMDIVSEAFPALLPAYARGDLEERQARSAASRGGLMATNDFMFDFTIKETERLAEFFRLPVSVIYPVTIKGGVCQQTHDLELNLSAPYLRQGSKLIEHTSLSAYIDGEEGRGRLDFLTTAPTKGGPMTVSLSASGGDNRLGSTLEWKIDRDRMYEGRLRVAAGFVRDDEGLTTTVGLRKSSLTFNDSTWTVAPATVVIRGKEVDVDGIHASHGQQFVKINGKVSPDPTALLTLDLRHFSLDYLFESLGIDAAMLGGDASGTFYASDLYSGQPRLETPGLIVKDISYNKTVLGDAVVKSSFNPSDLAVMLDADIDNHGRRSTVTGGIFAARDSLDLTFNVDREPVGFLQPYMAAFASDITGYASGRARVFGNFKYIDLEGDVKADSVSMRVNFTNTTYWATDSVHIRPGYIDLNGITVHDYRGNTANLNGWVRHSCFKEPRFEFAITGAKGLLCYNETAKENPRWYGRVYGDGGAFVRGEPGLVDIDIDMSTAPGSTFTFVLSDQVEADEYSFLTFRDKGRLQAELSDTLRLRDTSMDLVNRLRELAARHDEESSSDYNITIQMGVTPQAEINLVMDPVGGDRIRAHGAGHLRMDYYSANNDLKMFGTYTLDRGDYNFTLQDIIIKDFSIKPGSEIAFNGDPYAAQLDIKAAYSLNANLSDLDESFLNDSELNRTNVPVNAIMKVSGDIRQPEIAFDLEFPTLTSDIYRKVRSIISTDEMMNRQILYLLALNRFYTPEYMAGATRGNELVSVASSTLSSQLGNILGQISDNWNIAPALRSSRGDFSDVEVDVALSSRLLNNRLLFNGNLGYRDKSLNSNQFVGDFELEYLLNRSGNFRLKAYNRYNDQNYYLRSALTTQGVGIILRKDFDSLTSFLRPLLRRRKSLVTIPLAPATTPEASPLDTLPAPSPVSPDSTPATPGSIPASPAE